MQGVLKKGIKIGMYGLLALVALAVSLMVGGSKNYGGSGTAAGVPLTFADAPGSTSGSAGSQTEGSSGGSSSCEGSGSGSGSGSGGSGGSGSEGGGSGCGCGSGSGGSK